jgi:hypothetical protein
LTGEGDKLKKEYVKFEKERERERWGEKKQ